MGSGSFGIVKKACHKMTGKIYAIKIVKHSFIQIGLTGLKYGLTINDAAFQVDFYPLSIESSTYC